MAGIGEAVRIASAASFELSPISALCPDLYPDKEAQETLHSALDAIVITERITLQLSTTFNPYSPLFGVEYDPKGAEITRQMVMAAPEIAAGISSIAQGQYNAFINSDNEHKAAVATEGLLNVAMLIEAAAGMASKLGQLKQVGNLVETAEGLAQVGTATSLDVAVAKNTETLITATENNPSLKPLADKLKDCLETLNDWTRPKQELVPEGAFLPPRDGIVDVAKDIGKDIKSFGDDVGKNIEDYINRMVRKGDAKLPYGENWKTIKTNYGHERLVRTDLDPGRGSYNWEAINEQFSNDVVWQFERRSCVAACGEMLLDGSVSQKQLLDSIGDSMIKLAKELAGDWKYDTYASNEEILNLINDGPICVKLMENAGDMRLQKSLHEVVIDCRLPSGNFVVRDPFQGTKYEMSTEEFFTYWTGEAVSRLPKK
ncbi:MAG: hypothetical protein IAF58_16815 [Leptolyngbya sp.]|nr:hypothetical protein [Candidatus Melainabacteria bacterium]